MLYICIYKFLKWKIITPPTSELKMNIHIHKFVLEIKIIIALLFCEMENPSYPKIIFMHITYIVFEIISIHNNYIYKEFSD